MAESQRRAVENHRLRLKAKGLGRFEVRGLDVDKALLRAVAKQLAQGGTAASTLRATIKESVNPPAVGRGGILQALRRSPLVGADIHTERESGEGRGLDL